MINTPFTDKAASRVAFHQREVDKQLYRAKVARASLKTDKYTILSHPALLIWSFAAGMWLCSRRKVTKVVERPTRTVKQGPTLLSLFSTLLSVAALKYKADRFIGKNSPYNKRKVTENANTIETSG